MDGQQEFGWGGSGTEGTGGRGATRGPAARQVLVVGGGSVRGRRPQRTVYKALSGVTFQNPDQYMRQNTSFTDQSQTEELPDEGLDSLDSQAHALTPSPEMNIQGDKLRMNQHAEGGYFSLERGLSEEDAHVSLQDSLENLHKVGRGGEGGSGRRLLPVAPPRVPGVGFQVPASYHNPYRQFQPQAPGYGQMSAYVNPSFHQGYRQPVGGQHYQQMDQPGYMDRGYPHQPHSQEYRQRDSLMSMYQQQQRDQYASHDGSPARAPKFQAASQGLYPADPYSSRESFHQLNNSPAMAPKFPLNHSYSLYSGEAFSSRESFTPLNASPLVAPKFPAGPSYNLYPGDPYSSRESFHQQHMASPARTPKFPAGPSQIYQPSDNYSSRESFHPQEASSTRNKKFHPSHSFHAGEAYDTQYDSQEGAHSKGKYLYPNYPRQSSAPEPTSSKDENGPRKTSVLSADSLENLPLSPTSPISLQPPLEVRRTNFNDSLEDVSRPKMVSQLRQFFEQHKSSDSSSPETESPDEHDITEESDTLPSTSQSDEEIPKSHLEPSQEISYCRISDASNYSTVSSRETPPSPIAKTHEEESGQGSCPNPVVIPQQGDVSFVRSTQDPSPNQLQETRQVSCPSPVIIPRLGDVSFLRATQDTPQTLLASTRLVQATLKPVAKNQTFYISLENKFKLPEFSSSKSDTQNQSHLIEKEEESDGAQADISEDQSDSSGHTQNASGSIEGTDGDIEEEVEEKEYVKPADYEESQLVLQHYVIDWEKESLPGDQDSDIDEFFLVLNDTGDEDIPFISRQSSRKSSVESYERIHDKSGVAACIPEEPETTSSGPTSSSGLSPLIETTSEDGTSESYTPESRTPELPRLKPQSPKFRQSDRIFSESRRAELVPCERRSKSRTPEFSRKPSLTPEIKRAGSQTPEQRRFKPRTPELSRLPLKTPDSLKSQPTTVERQRSSPKIPERRKSEQRSPKPQKSDNKTQEPPSPRSQRPSDPRSPKSRRPDVLDSTQHSKPFLGLGKGKTQESHLSPALVSVIVNDSTLASAGLGVEEIETVTDNNKPVSNESKVNLPSRPSVPSPLTTTSNPSSSSEPTQGKPGDTIGGLPVHELAKIFNNMASSLCKSGAHMERSGKIIGNISDSPVGVNALSKQLQGVEEVASAQSSLPSDESGANSFSIVTEELSTADYRNTSNNNFDSYNSSAVTLAAMAVVQDLQPNLEALATVIAERIMIREGGGGGAEQAYKGSATIDISDSPLSSTTLPLTTEGRVSVSPSSDVTSVHDFNLREMFLKSCLQENNPYWTNKSISKVNNEYEYNNNNLVSTLSDPLYSHLVPNQIETIVNVVHMPDIEFPLMDHLPKISDIDNKIDKNDLTKINNPIENVVNIIHSENQLAAVNSKGKFRVDQLVPDRNIDADKMSDITVLPSDCSTCDSEIFIIHNQMDNNYDIMSLNDTVQHLSENNGHLLEKMPYKNNKSSPVHRQHSIDSKTSDYDPDTPLSDISFPIFHRKDSSASRKMSLESTNTTPDADYDFGDIFEKKECINFTNKNASNNSIISDNWEWFPGRKVNNKGLPMLEEMNVDNDKVDTRKISTVSGNSMQSSGIGSMNGSELCSSDLRKASINSVTSLAQIKEDTKKEEKENNHNSNTNSSESQFESDSSSKEGSPDFCHNISVDGKCVVLPPPVWPDVCENIGWKDPLSVRKKVQMNKKAFLQSVLGTEDSMSRQDDNDDDCDFKLHKISNRIKLSKADRGRRITLHTFQNIADEWKKQNEIKEETLKTGISQATLDQNKENDSNIIRINLIRDFEKLESTIDVEVQAMKSNTKIDGSNKISFELEPETKLINEEDNTSIIVAFDSSESILSAGSHHFSSDESTKEDDDIIESKFSNTDEIEVHIVTVSSSRDSILDETPFITQNTDRDLNSNLVYEEEISDYVVHRRKPIITLTSLRESKSLPNLSDVDEAVLLEDGASKNKDSRRESLKSFKSADTLTSLDEIIPYSSYQFSEVQFPQLIPYNRLEEQEANQNFSDEELGAFPENEHNNDLIDLNLELFEPINRAEKLKENSLSKKKKKLTKLKRKFSFNKSETPIKESITNSLQRIKDAKDKFGRLVNKTLKSESASDILSSEYYPAGENCPELYGSHAHISCGHVNVLEEIRQRFQLEPQDPVNSICKRRCSSLDRSDSYITFDRIASRNSYNASDISRKHSLSSDNPTSPEPCDYRLVPDGQESLYSWSDADSDFEFIPMGPSKKISKVMSGGIGIADDQYHQFGNKNHYGFSREFIENEKLRDSSISSHMEDMCEVYGEVYGVSGAATPVLSHLTLRYGCHPDHR